MYHQHQVPYERIKLPIYYKYPINTVENTLQKLLKKRHLPSSTLYTCENTIHMKPPWQWQVYLQVSLWDAARNAHARKADEGQPLAEKPRVSNGSHKMSIFLPGLVNIQKSNWKMAIEIVDLPWFTHPQWWIFPVRFLYVYQRVDPESSLDIQIFQRIRRNLKRKSG